VLLLLLLLLLTVPLPVPVSVPVPVLVLVLLAAAALLLVILLLSSLARRVAVLHAHPASVEQLPTLRENSASAASWTAESSTSTKLSRRYAATLSSH
jgi:hypothetical protein